MKRRLAVLTALLWPAIGNACAVCGAAADRNQAAMLAMTIMLSLLPLAMFAAGGWWLLRKTAETEAREDAQASPRVEIGS